MVTTWVTPKYGGRACGCWFSECRGIYIGEAIIQEAIGHRFEIKDIAAPYMDSQFYDELILEAEEYMQQFAADGYYFGFSEQGDWGLWECEEDA